MSANPTFWEVFVRPATSSTWRLVTPPGVADNGGLVAAADAGERAHGGGAAQSGSRVHARSPRRPTRAPAGRPTGRSAPAWPPPRARSPPTAVSWRRCSATGRSRRARTAAVDLGDAGQAGRDRGLRGRPEVRGGARHLGLVRADPRPGARGGRAAARAGPPASSPTRPADGWQRLSLPVAGQLVRLGAGTRAGTGQGGADRAVGGQRASLVCLRPASSSATPAPTSSPGSSADWTASAPLPVTNAVTASGGLAGTTATVVGRDVGAAAGRAGGDHRRARAAVAAAAAGARPHDRCSPPGPAAPSTRWPCPGRR